MKVNATGHVSMRAAHACIEGKRRNARENFRQDADSFDVTQNLMCRIVPFFYACRPVHAGVLAHCFDKHSSAPGSDDPGWPAGTRHAIDTRMDEIPALASGAAETNQTNQGFARVAWLLP